MDESATAVVEMALVLPILILLAFGILDFGRATNYKNEATQLANAAARYAAVNVDPNSTTSPPAALTTCAALKNWLKTQTDTGEMLTMLNQPNTVAISFGPNGATVTNPVTVTLTVDFTWLSFFSKLFGSPTKSLVGTATMRLEQPTTLPPAGTSC